MRTNSKFVKIYRDLLEKIQSGQLKIGQTLPPEVSLAKQYGVAVLTLRRALARLREEGWIVSRPHHGSKITSPDSPNTNKTSLKSIGLFVPAHANALTHPPTSQLINGIESIASTTGYALDIFYNDKSNPDLRTQLIAKLKHSHTRGWLIPTSLSAPVLSHLQKLQSPAVFIHYTNQSLSEHVFQINFESMAHSVLTHFLEQNRKNIWIFSPPNSTGWIDSILNAATSSRFPGQVQVKMIEDYTVTAGIKAAQELLTAKEPFNAVICADDEIATGAIQALQVAGHSVPESVAVIGGGDFAISSLLSPTISTIRYPYYNIGREATRLLIDLLEGIDIPPAHRLFLPKLIIRESSSVAVAART